MCQATQENKNANVRFKASMILLFGDAEIFGDLERMRKAYGEARRGKYEQTKKPI